MPSCSDGATTATTELRDDLILMVPDLGSSLALKLIQRAATEFFRRTTRWREDINAVVASNVTTAQLTHSTARITLINTVFYTNRYAGNTERLPERREIDHGLNHRYTQLQGSPYWYSSTPTILQFGPETNLLPQTLIVNVALTPINGNVPDELIRRYRESLICGARYYAHSITGKNYTDRREAAAQYDMFMIGIQAATRHHMETTQRNRPHASRVTTLHDLHNNHQHCYDVGIPDNNGGGGGGGGGSGGGGGGGGGGDEKITPQPPIYIGDYTGFNVARSATVSIDITSAFTAPAGIELSYTMAPAIDGIRMDPSGIIRGQASTAGSTLFIIAARSPDGQVAYSDSILLNVGAELPTAPVYVGGSQQLTLVHGDLMTPFDVKPLFTYPGSIIFTASALPAGVAFQDGVFTGTPTALGTLDILVTARDRRGQSTVSDPLSFTVSNAVPEAPAVTGNLPDQVFTVGAEIQPINLASYFISTDQISIDTSTPPDGLVVQNGILQGTPTTPATTTLTVTATDTASQSAQFNVDIEVTAATANPPAIVQTIPTFNLLAGVSMTPVSVATSFSSSRPLLYSMDPIPPGLLFSQNGALAGAPTTIGTTAVVFTATDDLGQSVSTPDVNIAVAANGSQPIARLLPPSLQPAKQALTLPIVVGDTVREPVSNTLIQCVGDSDHRHTYSLLSPENSDGTKLLLQDWSNNNMQIYNAATLALERDLGLRYHAERIMWAFTDPDVIYSFVRENGTTGPTNQLVKYNISTDAHVLLHDFSQAGTEIWCSFGEGNGQQDWNDQFVLITTATANFLGDAIDMIVFDLQSGTIHAQLPYPREFGASNTPAALAGQTIPRVQTVKEGSATVSRDGAYVVLSRGVSGSFLGMYEIWDIASGQFTNRREVGQMVNGAWTHLENTHMCTTVDDTGRQVLATESGYSFACYTDLQNLEITRMTTGGYGHTGACKALPGYVVHSSYKNLEDDAASIGTTAVVLSPVRRGTGVAVADHSYNRGLLAFPKVDKTLELQYCYHRSDGGTANLYNTDQPHAALATNGVHMYFKSNRETPGGPAYCYRVSSDSQTPL